MPRSGSTLLRYVLDTHEEIYCPPELHLGTLFQRCSRVSTILGDALAPSSELSLTKRELDREARRGVNRVIGMVSREYGKKNWGEKSTSTVDYLPVFKRFYPKARYICLYRHAMDVVHSGLEIAQCGFWPEAVRGARNTVDAMVRYWCQKTKLIQNLELEKPVSCFRVKYESIVLEPQKVVPELFSFLKLKYTPQLLNRIFQSNHHEGEGDVKIRSTNRIEKRSVGQGRKVPVGRIERSSLEQMNALLAALEYEVVGMDWNRRANSRYGAGDKLTSRFVQLKLKEIFEKTVRTGLRKGYGGKGLRTCRVEIKDVENAVWLIDFNKADCKKVSDFHDTESVVAVGFEALVKVAKGETTLEEQIAEGQAYHTGSLQVLDIVERLFRAECAQSR